MKKNILILLFMFSYFGIAAQDIQVPAEVNKSFHKDFPSATAGKWQKEGGNYETQFNIDNVRMRVAYSKSGYRKEVEKTVEESTLPREAFDYILKNYSGFKLKTVSQSTTDKALVTYKVEITNGTKSQALIFDAKGKFKKKN